MVKIKFLQKFNDGYNLLCSKDPALRNTIADQIKIFINNPQDSRLRNHKLKWRLRGKWAFSITDDIRIIYELKGKNNVRFLAIGTHEDVYSKKIKKQ